MTNAEYRCNSLQRSAATRAIIAQTKESSFADVFRARDEILRCFLIRFEVGISSPLQSGDSVSKCCPNFSTVPRSLRVQQSIRGRLIRSRDDMKSLSCPRPGKRKISGPVTIRIRQNAARTTFKGRSPFTGSRLPSTLKRTALLFGGGSNMSLPRYTHLPSRSYLCPVCHAITAKPT